MLLATETTESLEPTMNAAWTIEDLMELHPLDNQENQADDGTVVFKDLLSIKNLKRLYSILDPAQNLVDEIDANSQSRKAFKMGIQNTFTPYKST
ncbi:hypothetical protein QE152_g26578 [Popillia japonica]|uniref:Uncharacterized protein n=1 Tax=Popillia japonica TaxID=7064 RepID=A0AAW1JYA7_POPJA